MTGILFISENRIKIRTKDTIWFFCSVPALFMVREDIMFSKKMVREKHIHFMCGGQGKAGNFFLWNLYIPWLNVYTSEMTILAKPWNFFIFQGTNQYSDELGPIIQKYSILGSLFYAFWTREWQLWYIFIS